MSKPAPPPPEDCTNCLENCDVVVLERMSKAFNMINAALLIMAGVMAFLELEVTLLIFLSAIYVISLSTILFAFELQCSMMESVIFQDCGFMFNWFGRTMFLIFVGSLAFGLGDWGTLGGIVTVANVIWTFLVMAVHTDYKNYMKNKNSASALKAGKRSLEKAGDNKFLGDGGSGAAPQQQQQQPTRAPDAPSLIEDNPASGNTMDGGWERILDEDSGAYYYYNSRTKETRWDNPP